MKKIISVVQNSKNDIEYLVTSCLRLAVSSKYPANSTNGGTVKVVKNVLKKLEAHFDYKFWSEMLQTFQKLLNFSYEDIYEIGPGNPIPIESI